MSTIQRNRVQTYGRGKHALVFAHGFGCDQTMWRYVAPSFEDTFRVVLFDHVGSGRSDLSAYDFRKYNSLDGYASDLLEIIGELALGSVTLVAHSVSCMIGVLAANRRPALFERLVLIGPCPRYFDDEGYVGSFRPDAVGQLLESLESNYLGWSRSMAPAIMGNPDRPELGEELTNSFCRAPPKIGKHFARVAFLSDNRSDLPKVSTPTLILQASDDVVAPEHIGRYVQSVTPQSEFVLLQASGHCPHLSCPEETTAAIASYVQ